jgi:hypothetical protein
MTNFPRLVGCGLALTSLLLASTHHARANVYATNIKLNGGTTSITTTQGAGIYINYVLNDGASGGVTVNINSSTNVLRSINVAGGSPGALRGTNTVLWDTRDNGGTQVTQGVYSISITAAAIGYTNWTQITPDTTNYYVFAPRCVAVNVNTNSRYYGRVMIGNAANGPSQATVAGDKDGIIKYNADGSFADEGAYSTAGYAWSDEGVYACPQKIRIGDDDRIYALDFNGNGLVVACDMLMQTNQIVLDTPNYSDDLGTLQYGWGAMDITGAGTTNALVWLGEVAPGNGPVPPLGVRAWKLTNGVADPNDHAGKLAVQASGGSDLRSPSGGFMADIRTNIFVGQKLDTASGGSRVLLFSNWNGVTALTTNTWNSATGDDAFRYDADLALDSRVNPKLVAISMINSLGIDVLNAGDGSVATNINSGTSYRAVAWDNVGNLYAVADGVQRWRVFSPPGTNRATTAALKTVSVITAQTPQITSVSTSNGFIVILFTGSPSDSPSTFSLRNASVVNGPYWDAANATVTQISPGLFRATAPMQLSAAFYRILRRASPALPKPQITDINASGGLITIHFSALTNDVPGSFTTLSAPTVDGPYSSVVATIISLGSGLFQATLPDPIVTRFYDVVR